MMITQEPHNIIRSNRDLSSSSVENERASDMDEYRNPHETTKVELGLVSIVNHVGGTSLKSISATQEVRGYVGMWLKTELER